MKTKLTPNQMCDIFGLYVGCEVDISATQYAKIEKKRLRSVKLISVQHSFVRPLNDNFVNPALLHLQTNIYTQNNGTMHLVPKMAKLILKPLLKLSDKDAIAIAKMSVDKKFDKFKVTKRYDLSKIVTAFSSKDNDNRRVVIDYEDVSVYIIDDDNMNRLACNHALVIQFLTKNWYAIPVFIAEGHELNGKTPIELGIAVEAKTKRKATVKK